MALSKQEFARAMRPQAHSIAYQSEIIYAMLAPKFHREAGGTLPLRDRLDEPSRYRLYAFANAFF